MKKVSSIVCFLFISLSVAFADIDAESIPDIITSMNHARFRLDRAEATINVYEEYNINIGFSILDVDSAILNNNFTVNSTSLKDGNVIVNDDSKQFFLFPKKIFVGAGMKVNGIGIGLGYQFSYHNLTLRELEAIPASLDPSGSPEDIIDSIQNAFVGVSDRFITTHTISFGMTFLDDTVELNIPFSFTAANKNYYSTSFGAPSSASALKDSPKGNMAFSVFPKVRYNTGGIAFTYIETTIGFGINSGSQKTSSTTYSDGHAVTVFAGAEMGLQIITNPITILAEPDISIAVGFNSGSEMINALDGQAHMAQYIRNNTPVKIEVKVPVKFYSSIGNAISMYGTPILGLSYAQHGASGIDEGVGNDSVYGAIYGFEAGFEFTPIENLTFGFELQGLGGPQISLDDDFVYITNPDNINSSTFTFGLNASLVWRF